MPKANTCADAFFKSLTRFMEQDKARNNFFKCSVELFFFKPSFLSQADGTERSHYRLLSAIVLQASLCDHTTDFSLNSYCSFFLRSYHRILSARVNRLRSNFRLLSAITLQASLCQSLNLKEGSAIIRQASPWQS